MPKVKLYLPPIPPPWTSCSEEGIGAYSNKIWRRKSGCESVCITLDVHHNKEYAPRYGFSKPFLALATPRLPMFTNRA